MESPAPAQRHHRVTVAVLACLAVVAGTGLAVGLTERPGGPEPDGSRPLSAAEARRLSLMRLTNHRTGRVGVHATLGPAGSPTRLGGWVDWGRGLVYLSVDGPGAGAQRGLLQAVPGVVATRPARGRPDAATGPSAHPAPPRVPPADGWRVRRLAGASGPVDALAALLLGIAADRPDPVAATDGGTARWVGRGRPGDDVDVLLAPAPAATGAVAGTPSAARVRYWLDADARLHRIEAQLAGGAPAVVDLDRTSGPELVAIDALGGPPVRPRAVTDVEADRLARMRLAGHARGGAEVVLTVPTLPATEIRGVGWVDWRRGVAYLRLTDRSRPAEPTLLRADERTVAARPAPTAADPAARPPLPPPGGGWVANPWRERADADGGFDLDLLVGEVLAAGRPAGDETGRLRASAVWLRDDHVDERTVSVFEIPKPAEAGEPPGRARLRYWVDQRGLLRRLELRTRTGAFAQLDLRPGRVPRQVAAPVG